MTELVEGLVQQFVHCTTGPFNVAILVGVAASSFWLFEICNFFGDMMLPTTRDQQDPFLVEISEVADLTMWKWVSGRARVRNPLPLSSQNHCIPALLINHPADALRESRSYQRHRLFGGLGVEFAPRLTSRVGLCILPRIFIHPIHNSSV